MTTRKIIHIIKTHGWVCYMVTFLNLTGHDMDWGPFLLLLIPMVILVQFRADAWVKTLNEINSNK